MKKKLTKILIILSVITVFIFWKSLQKSDLDQVSVSVKEDLKNVESNEQKNMLLNGADSKTSKPNSFTESLSPEASKNGESPIQEFLVGSKSYSIVFETSGLSQEVRKTIAEELQSIFGHNESNETLTFEKKRSFNIEGNEIKASAYLNLKGPWPDAYEGIMPIIEINDQESIVVDDSLVSAYVRALLFRKENREAFERLSEFTQNLSDLSEKEYKTSSLFYVHPSLREHQVEINFDHILEEIKKQQYRNFSLLDVQTRTLDKVIPVMLTAPLYVIENNRVKPGVTLVYNKGRWRIFLSVPGS